MSIYTILLIALAVILPFALYFYWQTRKLAQQAYDITTHTGMRLVGNPKSATFSGAYRGYEGQIQTRKDAKGQFLFTELSLFMQNPNHKQLHVFVGEIAGYPTDYQQIGSVSLKENFTLPVQGLTNDMLFAGVLLNENAKKAIQTSLMATSKGMVALQGNALVYLSTVKMQDESAPQQWANQLEVLAKIKDGLQ